MKAEKLSALKEEVETMSKKLVELTDEELEKVTGGWECTLTDKMIEGGEYSVRQADTIFYNGEKYINQHQCTNIDGIDMFLYQSGTGVTLLIPFSNYN